MIKRLTATIALCVVLIAGVTSAAAQTMSGDDGLSSGESTVDETTIWEGLCVGASLNLSASSRVRCARQANQAEQNRRPARPPNIPAGLCVGASLNLSKQSERNCRRQVREGQLNTGSSANTGTTGSKSHPGGKTNTAPPPAPEPTPQRVQYAALGDSVAAGQGLAELSGSLDQRCDRSLNAYAFDVGRTFGLQPSLIACRGATMGDLITEQGISGTNPPPQLDAAFAAGKPDLITITAGANDIHWDSFLRKCYTGTCGTATDERVASALLGTLAVKTEVVLNQIEQRSNGTPPLVIITGYYHPLSEQCSAVEPRLTTAEIAWLNAQTDRLNQTLQQAAANHGSMRFAPIDFTGHDICSDNPWVQGLNGRAPFHPTEAGQQAIAEMIN